MTDNTKQRVSNIVKQAEKTRKEFLQKKQTLEKKRREVLEQAILKIDKKKISQVKQKLGI